MSSSYSGFGQLAVQQGVDAFVPKFRVVAHCVLVKRVDGTVHHAYRECLLDGLSDEQEKLFLEQGFVEYVTAPSPEEGAKS
jgi:hypothetical protein